MSVQEETAEQLRAIVAAIDEEQLVAPPRQRAYLVGAMEGLVSMPGDQMSTGREMSTDSQR